MEVQEYFWRLREVLYIDVQILFRGYRIASGGTKETIILALDILWVALRAQRRPHS